MEKIQELKEGLKKVQEITTEIYLEENKQLIQNFKYGKIRGVHNYFIFVLSSMGFGGSLLGLTRTLFRGVDQFTILRGWG